MSSEKRRYQRLVKPLQASFRGGSGATACRIADISWGGCFVQTLATPQNHERTAVSFAAGADANLTIEGRVVYVEQGMGFALQFDPLSEAHVKVLKDLLGNPDL